MDTLTVVRRHLLACDGEQAEGHDECYMTRPQVKPANAAIERAQEGCYWLADDETAPFMTATGLLRLLSEATYADFCKALDFEANEAGYTFKYWWNFKDSLINLINSLDTKSLEKLVSAELKRRNL